MTDITNVLLMRDEFGDTSAATTAETHVDDGVLDSSQTPGKDKGVSQIMSIKRKDLRLGDLQMQNQKLAKENIDSLKK